MQIECARQLCDGEAVAVCAIDPPSTTVVLLPLETTVVGSPLCRRHTDGLMAPAGWQLRDERPTRAVTRSAVIESDAPGAPLASEEPDGPPQTTTAGDDSFEALLDADSPLLSRAFRTAGH